VAPAPAPVEVEPDLDEEGDWEEVVTEAPHPQRPARAEHNEPHRTLGQSAARLRQSTETWLLRVLPDRVPERPDVPERVDEGISLTGRALAVVALIIPLLVLFVVMMTRIQYERTRDQQFSAILSLAQARYDAAIQIQDSSHMREGLREALNTINEGLSIDPADPSLNDLKRRILTKLDEADLVQRLYHYWKLAEVEDAPVSDTDSSRIIMQGVDVFVINRGSDRVYRYMLNDVGDAFQSVDTNSVLIRKGDTFRGVAVGDLVDIAWMEAGGQRTLSTFVTPGNNGSLLAYDPQQGIDLLPVAIAMPGSTTGHWRILRQPLRPGPLLGPSSSSRPTTNLYYAAQRLYPARVQRGPDRSGGYGRGRQPVRALCRRADQEIHGRPTAGIYHARPAHSHAQPYDHLRLRRTEPDGRRPRIRHRYGQ
jgi:hypothetical protein